MLAIAAAVVFGIYLLLDLLDVGRPTCSTSPPSPPSACCCSRCTWPASAAARVPEPAAAAAASTAVAPAAADRDDTASARLRCISGTRGRAGTVGADGTRRTLPPEPAGRCANRGPGRCGIRRLRRTRRRLAAAGADAPGHHRRARRPGPLLAPGAPLRQLVTGAAPMSVILWGPPGTGKTTIAHLVAAATDRRFVAMSALSAGVKDVRAVIDTARRERRRRRAAHRAVHRRGAPLQQDPAGLAAAAVEDRTVTLLAATTENPYFSVISPLLSRCVLLTLQPLDRRRGPRAGPPRGDRRARAGRRGHAHRRGRGSPGTAGRRRRPQGADRAGGGRGVCRGAQGVTEIDLATAEKAVDVAAVRYDRDGDAHYDVVSAFIKSMRGSDLDAALHWLARMLVAGEDPRFIARRMVIFASEDVGMADPQRTARSHRGRSGRRVRRASGGAAQPGAGGRAPGDRAEVQRVTTALGAAMADVRAGKRRRGAAAACATPTTRAPVVSVTAGATGTRMTIRAVW